MRQTTRLQCPVVMPRGLPEDQNQHLAQEGCTKAVGAHLRL